MDPVKRDGKTREQVQIEHEIRRRYNKKWQKVVEDKRNTFYENHILNNELKNMSVSDNDNTPYKYTNHGDSYFVSKKMYKALIETCRCGREKTNSHILKCLQKEQDAYLIKREDDGNENNCQNVKDDAMKKTLPKTSFGMCGWPKSRYVDWELSTKYRSLRYDMPGYKIDEKPYSNLFFG